MNHLLGFRFEIGFPLLCGLAILLGPHEVSAQNQTESECALIAVNKTFSTTVREIIDTSLSNAKNYDGDSMLFLTYLLIYTVEFPERGKSEKTPLETNFKNVYKPNQFYRVLNRHGGTLLDLAFNYYVVSVMTLTIGTRRFNVSLVERPRRCLDGLSENETMDVVLYLMARDFNETTPNETLGNDDKVCVQYIEKVDAQARFTTKCFLGDSTKSLEKKANATNVWLNALYFVLWILRLVLLFFGPLLLTGYVANLSNQSVPYVVKLKEPLIRSMFIAKTLKDFERVRGRRILDLSKCRGYPKMKEALLSCPMGVPFMAEIYEYDILAANKRLIKENEVPVTVWSTLAEAIFSCKMKNATGITECCYTDMFKSMPCVKKKVNWLSCCYKVGMLLLLFCIPFLYYIRLILFYFLEQGEINARDSASKKLNLTREFDRNFLFYFRPTHPLFISIYAIYFFSAICLAFLTRRDHEDRFRNIVVGSFQDLDRLSYLRVLKMAVENILWPFRRFGCMGVFVALVYWVVFIPCTLIICTAYILPTVYLLVRMTFYSRKAFLQTIRTRSGIRKYQTNAKLDESIQVFKTEFVLGDDKNAKPEEPRTSGARQSGPQEVDEMERFRAAAKKDEDKDSVASSIIQTLRIKPTRFAMHVMSAIVCVITLISLLIIVSECVGALAEFAVFTLMGLIVNAGVTTKYVGLGVMIMYYTYSCFSDVKDKYLRLNTFLFPELKNRVADLFDVTALPSYLQENEAFKSQQLSEQALHEQSDDVAVMPARHWFINDLVLFVDSQDTFRIPRRLFKAVCEIQVAGVPGPVHLGILESFISFLKFIIFLGFVVVVIQCFGSIYEVSSSVQTVAIVGSGFIPILMERFSSSGPDVEVNSLSFTSKLDEVIKNFWQLWPIHDFAFRVAKKSGQPDDLAKKLIFRKGNPDEQGGAKTLATGPTLQMESEIATGKRSKAKPIDENENMHNASRKHRPQQQENDPDASSVVDATAVAHLVARKSKPSPKVSAAGQDTQDPTTVDQATADAQLVARKPKKSPKVSAVGQDTQVNTMQTEVAAAAAAAVAVASPPVSTKKIDLFIDMQKATIELVDILVRVPAKYEDLWIDGWSNIVDYREVKKDKRESDIADTMLQAAAQSREERTDKNHKQGADLTDA